ncbi:MAG TPA: hypothetical protein VLM11_07805 [Streptosporangiaceae bacterium]|nr:hypothetical protein [Streptosporangiaceae bacterium]
MPVASTANVPATPVWNVALAGDVILGATSTTISRLTVMSGLTPLLALTVIGYVPTVPAAGVPENTPAGDIDTPAGRAPVSVTVAVGDALTTSGMLDGMPTANVADWLPSPNGPKPLTNGDSSSVALGVATQKLFPGFQAAMKATPVTGSAATAMPPRGNVSATAFVAASITQVLSAGLW